MDTRKLATIEKIIKIDEHPNADVLELATIKGWRCVVKKGEFKSGDLCVYFEVDSVLPEKSEFEFLRKACWNKRYKGFRLRTIRLRGQVSQGLALPVSILPFNIWDIEGEEFADSYCIGYDLTELLGVVKYVPEIPACLSGKAKGSFPDFIPKTEEERVENSADLLKNFKNEMIYITEKLDGCLSYGTKIKTDIGEIPIGLIVNQKLKVKVMSYNEDLKISEFKEIVDYYKYENNKKIISVAVAHRGKGNRPKYITCTDNHKFYTLNGYIEAKNLKIGDKVFHFSERLSFEQEQIILGSLLGDSSIRKNGNCVFFNFSHSIDQSDYFQYKKDLLGNIFIETKETRGGFEGSKENRRGYSISNLSIKKLIEEKCLISDKKVITKQWCNKLTPIALAFWYMDDGSINNGSNNQRPRAYLATNSFSIEEIILLQEMLFTKYNISSKIATAESYKGNVLYLDANSSEIFFSLVSPYICKSMKYKLPEFYKDFVCIFEDKSFNTYPSIIETDVLYVGNKIPSYEKQYLNNVYDLTIKDNHNYFAKNILTHNSSATYYLKDGEFGVCGRNWEWHNTGNTYWQIAEKYDIEERMRSHGDNIAVQGEIIGPGIQKNKYNLSEIELRLFNVFKIDGHYHGDLTDLVIIKEILEIDTVPILEEGVLLTGTVEDWIKKSAGVSYLSSKTKREGIVVRNYEKNRFSFKAVDPGFLLKYKE